MCWFCPRDFVIPIAFAGAWFWVKIELAAYRMSPPLEQQAKAIVTFPSGSSTLQLEVAHSDRDRATGLMYRRSLPRNAGMLFPLLHPYIPKIWMKHVNFPLDIIFIKQGRIESIVHNAPPCQGLTYCPTYSPPVAVDTVLELLGGRAKELNLVMGSKVVLPVKLGMVVTDQSP
ncbi:DUF192 domain-containing protein [Chroococcidiopsis sp. CCNUC1]|uniref:DUF192 domain-containing protein n=1 Tax=Chroococcidiopsis sp. CCNUC1 TaxID=2653189 RepID=UPI00202278E1|nr:DUF192 domain-containing protein [Chroococcidiopsis sp. CCNUC1]URD48724.1 DUF192 domain-containing protein [Chroococcidiopsis sp. CCNUC1]